MYESYAVALRHADKTILLPALPLSFDVNEDLSKRARGYLHSNCSQCHQTGTTVSSNIDFRYSKAFEDTNTCNVLPGLGDIGIGDDARLIYPGNANNSVVVARMKERKNTGGLHSSEQMPPLATELVDDDGVALISEWINSLDASCSE